MNLFFPCFNMATPFLYLYWLCIYVSLISLYFMVSFCLFILLSLSGFIWIASFYVCFNFSFIALHSSSILSNSISVILHLRSTMIIMFSISFLVISSNSLRAFVRSFSISTSCLLFIFPCFILLWCLLFSFPVFCYHLLSSFFCRNYWYIP